MDDLTRARIDVRPMKSRSRERIFELAFTLTGTTVEGHRVSIRKKLSMICFSARLVLLLNFIYIWNVFQIFNIQQYVCFDNIFTISFNLIFSITRVWCNRFILSRVHITCYLLCHCSYISRKNELAFVAIALSNDDRTTRAIDSANFITRLHCRSEMYVRTRASLY